MSDQQELDYPKETRWEWIIYNAERIAIILAGCSIFMWSLRFVLFGSN